MLMSYGSGNGNINMCEKLVNVDAKELEFSSISRVITDRQHGIIIHSVLRT